MLSVLLGAALSSFLAGGAGPKPSDATARDLVETAVARMGGRAALESLGRVRLEWIGYRNLLEQSERPEGPWIPQIEKTTELWDTPGGRWDESAELAVADEKYSIRTIVAGGVAARRFGEKWSAAGKGEIAAAEEWMADSPQRALLDALAASDLHREEDLDFQGVPHHAVAFGSGEKRRRILLNAETGFLTAIETLRAYPEDRFWQIWGDVPTRIAYSFWDLRPGGLLYPMQWDVERGGRPWRSFTLTALEPSPKLPEDAFAIPASITDAANEQAKRSLDDPSAPLGSASRPAVELAPGVVFVPGSWGVALVRQADGVVVLEAPISAGYSSRVLDEAKRRFPDLPVKAVVSTSDSWPHFGGIREYAARGIPIYLLDRNVPQIRRALESPHAAHPDALARAPRDATLHPVSSSTTIGEGDNRVALYPVRGETGERMMLAFLPGSGVLYASDLYQAGQNGPPEYAWEVAEVARRERLNVKTVFAMHSDPVPWETLLGIVEAARKSPPAGKD
jgi:hypothetical protein